MQQVQSHAASLPDTANGAASVVSQLAAMAKQRDEQFKQEQEMRKLREEEERRMRMDVKREDDLFGDDDLEYNSSYAGSKRDISQVDSPEEATRPGPSFVVLLHPFSLGNPTTSTSGLDNVDFWCVGWLVISEYSTRGR
jgi:hypothetical protein